MRDIVDNLLNVNIVINCQNEDYLCLVGFKQTNSANKLCNGIHSKAGI